MKFNVNASPFLPGQSPVPEGIVRHTGDTNKVPTRQPKHKNNAALGSTRDHGSNQHKQTRRQRGSKPGGNEQWRYENTGYPPPDKESYINTSWRFVLDSRGDYRHLQSDPDSYVPMDKVLRLLGQPSRCPICLEDVPIAARMLECGHILCAPCLYQFFSMKSEDETDRHKLCPLCFDRVRLAYVKPVSFTSDERFDIPKEGNEVVLRLMFRPVGSILSVPASLETANKAMFSTIPTVNSDARGFARLVLGDRDYALSEFRREISDLESAVAEMGSGYEDSKYWYKEAISLISISMNAKLDESPDLGDLRDELLALEISKHGSEFISLFDDSSAYYFYQTGLDSSTRFILSPLDVRILKEAYRAFSNFPPLQIVEVEHVEYGTFIDDNLRKRIKYLGHLPRHTALGMLECNWKGILDEAVLKRFSTELNQRQKRRKERLRRENRGKERYEQQQRQRAEQDLQEEGYRYVAPPQDYDLSNDPALPGQAVPSSDLGSKNEVNAQKSFAMVASANPDEMEMEQIIATAKSKGRKKLVLLSNSRI